MSAELRLRAARRSAGWVVEVELVVPVSLSPCERLARWLLDRPAPATVVQARTTFVQLTEPRWLSLERCESPSIWLARTTGEITRGRLERLCDAAVERAVEGRRWASSGELAVERELAEYERRLSQIPPVSGTEAVELVRQVRPPRV